MPFRLFLLITTLQTQWFYFLLLTESKSLTGWKDVVYCIFLYNGDKNNLHYKERVSLKFTAYI